MSARQAGSYYLRQRSGPLRHRGPKHRPDNRSSPLAGRPNDWKSIAAASGVEMSKAWTRGS
ncbi:MAG: hypothetical protein ACRENP_15505 [Longimicrobiales bacterium]